MVAASAAMSATKKSAIAEAAAGMPGAPWQDSSVLPPGWGKPRAPAGWGHPYPVGADSKRQPGVPRGEILRFDITGSTCYPGIQCPISVYVPQQYKAERAACLAFFFDGLIAHADVVFDNLIHKGEMPITIAIGMGAGNTPSAQAPANPRFDRSFEFDSTTEVMPDFILHEVLPAVRKHQTATGLPILLSDDPDERLVGGISSGGIAAFNLAWRRPDAFRRVCIISGTFVGMRGGNDYPVLVRKTEPKPLRVFINDGTGDEWWEGPEFGNWWLSNRQMEDALSFAGYAVNHIWGVGGHGEQGAAVFPDMMRWLWADWEQPIKPHLPGNFNMQSIIDVGESWQMIEPGQSLPAEPYQFSGYSVPPVLNPSSSTTAIASDAEGRAFFMNPSEGTIVQIDETGSRKPFCKVSSGSNGFSFGPDGRLYVAEGARSYVVAYDKNGHRHVITKGIAGRDLTITSQGYIYMTEAETAPGYTGKVWLINPSGETHIVADKLNAPSGVALSPDGLWLFVAESKGHHGWNYQVQPDGTLRYGMPFYSFHFPDAANDSGAGQICMDRDGRAYVATRMGIQVFDRNGRVIAIFPVLPSETSQQLAGVCFSGADFKTLYVTTGTRIYRRRVNVIGAPNWAASIALPHWEAG